MSNKPLEPSEEVIACNLGAIDPTNLDAHVVVAQDIFSSSTVLEIKELPQGYAFRLPLETPMLHKVINFIANERLCCPFFTFTLVVGAELWLELTGTDEVSEYIKSNLVAAIKTGAFPTVEELDAAYTASAGSVKDQG